MDIRNYFQKNITTRSDNANGGEQEAAAPLTLTGNVSTEVNSNTEVNIHARRVSYGS